MGTQVPTLAEFSADFIESYAVASNKPSEVKAKQMILRRHLVPFFGQMRLDEVGLREIERYKCRMLARRIRSTSRVVT